MAKRTHSRFTSMVEAQDSNKQSIQQSKIEPYTTFVTESQAQQRMTIIQSNPDDIQTHPTPLNIGLRLHNLTIATEHDLPVPTAHSTDNEPIFSDASFDVFSNESTDNESEDITETNSVSPSPSLQSFHQALEMKDDLISMPVESRNSNLHQLPSPRSSNIEDDWNSDILPPHPVSSPWVKNDDPTMLSSQSSTFNAVADATESIMLTAALSPESSSNTLIHKQPSYRAFPSSLLPPAGLFTNPQCKRDGETGGNIEIEVDDDDAWDNDIRNSAEKLVTPTSGTLNHPGNVSIKATSKAPAKHTSTRSRGRPRKTVNPSPSSYKPSTGSSIRSYFAPISSVETMPRPTPADNHKLQAVRRGSNVRPSDIEGLPSMPSVLSIAASCIEGFRDDSHLETPNLVAPILVNSNEEFRDDNHLETPHLDLSSLDHSSGPGFSDTALKLLAQLKSFDGCSEKEHEEQSRLHDLDVVDHYALANAYFHDIPKVLGYDVMLKDRKHNIDFGCNRQFRNWYTGSAQAGSSPPSICLHAEKTEPSQPETALDIDSYLFFVHSLAAARRGIWYNPTPQMTQNIRTDLHLHQEIQSEDQHGRTHREQVHIKDTPHLFLGNANMAKELGIYVLFPRLRQFGQKFTCLDDNQLRRWTDMVFLPALHSNLEANHTQHIPSSYAHARAQSTARQTEGRTHRTTSYQSRQLFAYFIPQDRLESIWIDVLRTVSTTPGLHDFADVQLFFSAKGTKLLFKPAQDQAPTVHGCLEQFFTFVDRVLDTDYMDLKDCYVDLGKETCPSVHCLSRQALPRDSEPQTLLWRHCCLKTYVQKMYGNRPNGNHVFYDVAMLRDTSNLSSTPSAKSSLRRDGLVYSQFYSSFKEIFDAGKTFPFANDGLEGLALDPGVRAAAAAAAHATQAPQDVLEKSYKHSKDRVNKAINGSIQKSFGVREEHRISWSLLQEIYQASLAHAVDDIDDNAAEQSRAVWPVRTENFLRYVWNNVNKYAAGFEMTAARCNRSYVTWEETKIMAMFLRCLRYSLVAHELAREGALWWSTRNLVMRSGETRAYVGLAFRISLLRYGYCWMAPLVDWKARMFKHRFRNKVPFGNSALMAHYKANWKDVQAVRDFTVQINDCDHWYRRFRNKKAHDYITHYMIHICLQQYRRDVVATLKKEVDPAQLDKAVQAMVGFSSTTIREIFGREPYLLNGNKSTIKEFGMLFDILWGTDGETVRTRFINKPYRQAYQAARETYKSYAPEVDPESSWERKFEAELVRYHWIYPVPDVTAAAGCMISVSKIGGHRVWWSLLLDPRKPDYRGWGKLQARAGTPDALPRMLDWTSEEMERQLTIMSV